MIERPSSETTLQGKTPPHSIYHIVFLHRCLRKRSEDRYIVDLAMALKNSGHRVTFFTSDLDSSDCLEEVNVRTFNTYFIFFAKI